jgi:uncharacterized protein (DUF2141 family)
MSWGNGIESLESRRLMAVSVGTNLLVNGDAEASAAAANATTIAAPSGWTIGSETNRTPGFTAVQYGIPTFPPLTSPGPAARGTNFFAGGPNDTDSIAFQTIDLKTVATDIDAGRLSAELSGWVGGFAAEGDHMILSMSFLDKNGDVLPSGGKVSAGTATAADRGNVTGFLFRSTMYSRIPASTRSIRVEMQTVRQNGTYNDSYADNVALKLKSTLATKGRIAGRAIDDFDGDGRLDSGESGLRKIKVFLDKDNDGKLDSGETSVTTDSKGRYTFENLGKGNYVVRSIVPSGYRSITRNPQTLTVSAGFTTSSNLLMSQTVLITGVAYIDHNDNHKRDRGDDVVENYELFLDFNDNDQLDAFEPKSTTNSKGVYRFVVPFGTYVIKALSGFRGTTAVLDGNELLVKVPRGIIKTLDYERFPE